MKANRVRVWCCYLPLVVLSAAVPGLIGCGLADYEARLEETIKGHRRTARFNELTPPIKLAGGNVSIRVPLKFTKRPHKLGEPGPEVAQALTPPFLKAGFPGSTIGYYDAQKDSKGHVQYEYQLYVSVFETPPLVEKQPRPHDLLLAELTKEFPKSNPPPAWQTIKVETDEGEATAD
jgi:hypothetical protein